MPNLVGNDLHKAKGRLIAIGLPVENIAVFPGDSAPDITIDSAWVVDTQEPPPGTVVPVCTECFVTLVVSPLLSE
jgi:hypothetical protein